MHKEFCLPDLGEGLTSAILRDWHVSEGQSVSEEQRLCSVETSKAIVDIPVPFKGQLVKLSANVGQTIATGSVLCTILPEVIVNEPVRVAEQKPQELKSQFEGAQSMLKQNTDGMDKNRAAMFDNLARAHLQVATATLTEMMQIKKKANTSNLIWALTQTLKEHKIFNATYTKRNGLTYYDEIDIGLAIQGEQGLFRVCVEGCEALNLSDIEVKINSLKSSPGNTTNSKSRMTLSNIGSTGIGLFATPSIMPPGLATLAIGRTEVQPEWDENTEKWQPSTKLPLSLSFDHRIITGVEAANFLRTFMSHLI